MRDERIGQILADQIEPENVEHKRQQDQDERSDQRNADQFEPSGIECRTVVIRRLPYFDLEGEQPLRPQHQDADDDQAA